MVPESTDSVELRVDAPDQDVCVEMVEADLDGIRVSFRNQALLSLASFSVVRAEGRGLSDVPSDWYRPRREQVRLTPHDGAKLQAFVSRSSEERYPHPLVLMNRTDLTLREMRDGELGVGETRYELRGHDVVIRDVAAELHLEQGRFSGSDWLGQRLTLRVIAKGTTASALLSGMQLIPRRITVYWRWLGGAATTVVAVATVVRCASMALRRLARKYKRRGDRETKGPD